MQAWSGRKQTDLCRGPKKSVSPSGLASSVVLLLISASGLLVVVAVLLDGPEVSVSWVMAAGAVITGVVCPLPDLLVGNTVARRSSQTLTFSCQLPSFSRWPLLILFHSLLRAWLDRSSILTTGSHVSKEAW
jgi:Flp pilus assembly protein TadB